MGKSIERQVKDAIITSLGSLPDVDSVETSGRGKIVAESELASGLPAVFVTFPTSSKLGGCGYVRVLFQVNVQARFLFDGDLDEMDMEEIRDALDALEQNVHAAMTDDPTWNGLAFDTRAVEKVYKITSEDVNAPEAMISLSYEVEVHHLPGDPESAI